MYLNDNRRWGIESYTMQAIQIIRKTEQVTTTWSGGTTTEFAIFPPGAEYKKRDFFWRISTAVINDEKSVFTELPGFWRILMVIDGELALTHEGHHVTTLRPFEQDQFSGGWETTSVGKATDFNVMLAQGFEGNIETLMIESGAEKLMPFTKTPPEKGSISILYTPHQDIHLVSDGYRGLLERGDVLIVDGSQISEKWNLTLRNDNPLTMPIIFCNVYQS